MKRTNLINGVICWIILFQNRGTVHQNLHDNWTYRAAQHKRHGRGTEHQSLYLWTRPILGNSPSSSIRQCFKNYILHALQTETRPWKIPSSPLNLLLQQSPGSIRIWSQLPDMQNQASNWTTSGSKKNNSIHQLNASQRLPRWTGQISFTHRHRIYRWRSN